MLAFLICKRKAGAADFSLLLKGGVVLRKGERPDLRDCYATEAAAKAVVTRLNRKAAEEKSGYIYSVSDYHYC